MSEIALRVENISKLYQIGTRQRGDNLREVIMLAVTAPFKKSAQDAESGLLWALRDVSFELKHGDVLGIIGRNGSGKSTLLKILSRITRPTSGFAEIHGRIGSLLEVGTGFHPELTGRENVYMNGAILGMKRTEIERKFDEIVAFSEIEQFLETPVKRYSSGMYTRLAFAVAAHLDPEILIVDEVLAVGDAAFQKKCLGKMSDVASQGRTVLFVSHNMTAIHSLCDKALLLNRGKVVRFGETKDVAEYYIEMQGSQDLQQRQQATTREKATKATIKDFVLTDSAGVPLREVDAHTGMTAEFTIDCLPAEIADICVQFTICDDNAFPLAHFNNAQEGDPIHLRHGINTITCRVPNLPFRTGNYIVNLGLFKGSEPLDHIPQVMIFKLVNHQQSRGIIAPPNAPRVLVAQQWEEAPSRASRPFSLEGQA